MLMQREVIDGIPFWCDKENKLYYYDVNLPKTLFLGTKSPEGTAKLHEDWQQFLASTLNQYRLDAVARNRKPAAKP